MLRRVFLILPRVGGMLRRVVLLSLFPFHCWARSHPSFHCGVITRFTVGPGPPSSIPVSLLASSPPPCRLFPHNVDKVGFLAPTKVSES